MQRKKPRRLKGQFIDGINDDDMITEIIRELTAVRNEITSKQVLARIIRVDSQGAQKALSKATKDNNEKQL